MAFTDVFRKANYSIENSSTMVSKQAKKKLSPSATGALFPPKKTEDDSHQDMMASEMN